MGVVEQVASMPIPETAEDFLPEAAHALVGIISLHDTLRQHMPQVERVVGKGKRQRTERNHEEGDRLRLLQDAQNYKDFKEELTTVFKDRGVLLHVLSTARDENFGDYFSRAMHGRIGLDLAEESSDPLLLPHSVNVRTATGNLIGKLMDEFAMEEREPVLSAVGVS